MEVKLIVIVLGLLKVASSLPFDNSRVYIPPLISNIYQKMIEAMEQGDPGIVSKYKEIVRTLHWLEPITLGKKK